MTFNTQRSWPVCFLSLALIGLNAVVGSARAQDNELWDISAPGHWRAVIGPYTWHLNEKPEFQYVWAVAIERQRDDLWLYGASYFSNSFGQGCGYLYMGRQHRELFDVPQLYFQWSVGLLYGYKPPYQHRVPLNVDGFSPAAVVSIGWQIDDQFAVQLNKVGASGTMLQLSYAWR
jgi:hypothetical protein